MTPNPRPKPPTPGGEHTQFIDTGPQGVSPGATRVNLIPVGDGGPGSPPPPVRRKKRKPLLPGKEEIAKLPRQARVAFAVRCVRRSRPVPQQTGPPLTNLLSADGQAAALAVALAAHDPAAAGEAVVRAGETILRAASDPRDLLFIRRDFDRVRRLARANGWTDETPVSQDVFGPMWPGRVPKWAREASGPRE